MTRRKLKLHSARSSAFIPEIYQACVAVKEQQVYSSSTHVSYPKYYKILVKLRVFFWPHPRCLSVETVSMSIIYLDAVSRCLSAHLIAVVRSVNRFQWLSRDDLWLLLFSYSTMAKYFPHSTSFKSFHWDHTTNGLGRSCPGSQKRSRAFSKKKVSSYKNIPPPPFLYYIHTKLYSLHARLHRHLHSFQQRWVSKSKAVSKYWSPLWLYSLPSRLFHPMHCLQTLDTTAYTTACPANVHLYSW